ncbi:MAG TPA: dihydroorotate dehydrogenase [Deltaproteobacteria bacterium]|nr:dihydroorotate dehydrogenase [Deltaproteobacteria bacterium]
MKSVDLSVDIGPKLKLKNPVMNASGTFAYGEEFARFMDLGCLGAVVTKGLSLEPKCGNPTPRVAEAPSGMLNAIGLENVGLERFLEEKLPFLKRYDVPVIVNFFGASETEYARMAGRLDQTVVDALEMNVSCPNVKKGGIQFGRDPYTLASLVKVVRGQTSKPLIVKLSPLTSDIAEMARAAEEYGADALTCINTIPAMAVDEETLRPVLGNITGGLSGPAIKPVALKMVWETARAVKIPVIAAGGIACARDAVQFFLAGARACQIGTQALVEPFCFDPVIAGIEDYLKHHGFERLTDIVGALKV